MPVIGGDPIVHRVPTRRPQRAHTDAGHRAANLRLARRPQVAVRSDHCHRGERRLQILVERRADPGWSGTQGCVLHLEISGFRESPPSEIVYNLFLIDCKITSPIPINV